MKTTDTERIIRFKDAPRNLKSFAHLSDDEMDKWEELFNGIFLFDTNRKKPRGIFFNAIIDGRLVIKVKNEKLKNVFVFTEPQIENLKNFLNTHF